MNAFAAAARVMFRNPDRSVAALYTPAGGGMALALRIILAQPTDQVAGFGGNRATAAQNSAEILREDVPERPLKGAVLAFGDRVCRVASPATIDLQNIRWKVTLSDV